MAVEFFAPEDGLSLGGVWEIQNHNTSQSANRAAALGANGDELPSTVVKYGGQKSVTFNYVCKAASGNVALPKLGAIASTYGGFHIDSYTATYNQQGALTLAVTAHKHGNGGTAHGATRTYSPTVVLPARVLGIPSKIEDADENTLFELLATSGMGMRSLSYTFTVNHVDEDDGDGEHLAGDDYDATETLAGEITGNATETTHFTVAGATTGTGGAVEDAGWINTSGSTNVQNTAATTTSFSLEHHVAHDAD